MKTIRGITDLKDKKILLRSLTEMKIAMAICVNLLLQYDYLYKKIKLYKDPQENFRTFREKSAPRYGINNQEIDAVTKLFCLIEKHKQGSFEFLKDEKIIILSESLRQETITLEKIKELLGLSKEILKKTKKAFLR